jgi:hypothetical protein
LKLSIPSQSSRNLPRFLRLLYCRRPTVSVPSASHWAYSGFAVETHDSGEYRCVRGKLQRNRERITVRGLNDNHNKDLKNLFKSAAISASTRPGPLQDFYVALLAKGIRPTMARLTLARKMAAVSLTIWKKEVNFDPKQLHRQAA